MLFPLALSSLIDDGTILIVQIFYMYVYSPVQMRENIHMDVKIKKTNKKHKTLILADSLHKITMEYIATIKRSNFFSLCNPFKSDFWCDPGLYIIDFTTIPY